MKITMNYQDETCTRSISADEYMEIEQIVELFKSFLLVLGYHPDTVNEWVCHYEESRKESRDE